MNDTTALLKKGFDTAEDDPSKICYLRTTIVFAHLYISRDAETIRQGSYSPAGLRSAGAADPERHRRPTKCVFESGWGSGVGCK